MNRERRKELSRAIDLLDEAKSKLEEATEIVQTCKDEEDECYCSLPESLQEGEKGDIMQENSDNLDEALTTIEDMPGTIDEAINLIQEAIDR